MESMLSNREFKQAVIEYLEYKDLTEISQLMKTCEIILTDTGQFTYAVWNQTQIHADIRVPIPILKRLEKEKQSIIDVCKEVYPSDNKHALTKVTFGMKISEVVETEESNEQPGINVTGGQVFDNLITKVHKVHIDSIEKDYILEGCYCAKQGHRLAAATMIGCAAERLLYQLCESYLAFLENNNGTEREIRNFKDNVLNARKAHARLDGFLKTVQNKESIFKQIGLENSNLHFSFLDIMRQVRNESGHPTGVKVTAEDLSSIFANYQLLIERVHPIIIELPTFKE